MSYYRIIPGSKDQTVYVLMKDIDGTGDGIGAHSDGLLFNTTNLKCYYIRERAAATQLPLVTQTVTGAHTDGGFVEVSSSNAKGVYRLDLSDGIVASGSPYAKVVVSRLTVATATYGEVNIDLQSGGPVEHTPVPKSRTVYVSSRGDGSFNVNGRIRMSAGETLWWAADLAGTQLSPGDLVDSMSAPSVSGADSANMTVPSYGVFGTLVKFKCVLSASAATDDVINVDLSVTPDGSETLKITVPVTVGS